MVGSRIWGGNLGVEGEGMIERMHDRYIRLMLGVDSRTLGYMVREEIQRELIKGRDKTFFKIFFG